ncbi:MAG TPA: hypothetical protein VIL40_03595 [Thermaerobacter sp.]
MGTVALLFALAVLVVARYAALYGMNRAIIQRQQEVARLERANQHLALEVARRDALDRLEAAARARGYEAPDALRAVRVPDGTPAGAVAGGTAGNGQAAAAGSAANAGAQRRAVRETVVALGADSQRAGAAASAGGASGGPVAWLARVWQRVFGG